MGKRPCKMVFESWSNAFGAMIFSLLSISVLLCVAAAFSDFRQRCLALHPEQLVAGATLDILSYVPANTTLSFPDNDASCNRKTQLVSADICRMALSIKTSDHSSIIFEAWFPETWSGRFLATGNGGIDGCSYNPLFEKKQSLTTPRHQV